MSKIIVEIRDKDLLEFGELRIKEEMEKTLKWLKMKGLLTDISTAIGGLKIEFEKDVDQAKEEAWQEYKKDLPL